MLTMNMELWPFGDEESAKRLVTINLANMGSSFTGHGYDYIWTIDEPAPLFGAPIISQGVLLNYDRKASCVNILAAIMDSYRNDPNPKLPEWASNAAQKLRNKTLAKIP